eukprot:gene4952-21297_t
MDVTSETGVKYCTMVLEMTNSLTVEHSMYASKGKGSTNTVPSEAEASEKLALYVYEYLRHVGAPKAAQTFLSEIRWEKNITLGEAPGFLHAWWSVFWDLYCAAPERRESCDHSSEAKAFHDLSYSSTYNECILSKKGLLAISFYLQYIKVLVIVLVIVLVKRLMLFTKRQNSGTLPSPSYAPGPPNDMPMGGMQPGFYQPPPNTRHPSLSQSQTPPHPQPSPLPQTPAQAMMHSQYMQARYGGPRPPGLRMPGQPVSSGVPGQNMMQNSMDPSRQQQAHSPYQSQSMMNPMQRMNHSRIPVPPNYSPMRPMPNSTMGPTGMPMGPRGPWSAATTPTSMTPGPPGTPILPSPQDPTTPYGIVGTDAQGDSMNDGSESIDGMPEDTNESVAIQRIKESMKEEVKKFEFDNHVGSGEYF